MELTQSLFITFIGFGCVVFHTAPSCCFGLTQPIFFDCEVWAQAAFAKSVGAFKPLCSLDVESHCLMDFKLGHFCGLFFFKLQKGQFFVASLLSLVSCVTFNWWVFQESSWKDYLWMAGSLHGALQLTIYLKQWLRADRLRQPSTGGRWLVVEAATTSWRLREVVMNEV